MIADIIPIALQEQAGEALRAICQVHGASAKAVLGRSRRPFLVRMRRILAVYLRSHGWSTTGIGAVLGRDHSTVVSLLRGGKHRRRQRGFVQALEAAS